MREFAAGAVLPRAAGRPDLGGHVRDPAADHRPGAREARRRTGSSGDGPERARRRAPPGASTCGRSSRRGRSRSSGRRRGAGSPRRSATTCGRWAARRAATSSTRSTTSCYGQPCYPILDALPGAPGHRGRGAQPAAGRVVTEAAAAAGDPGGRSSRAAAWSRAARRRPRCRPRSRGSPGDTAWRSSARTAWASSTSSPTARRTSATCRRTCRAAAWPASPSRAR